jgi:riboflavin kinase/FMN adenylyltransferase
LGKEKVSGFLDVITGQSPLTGGVVALGNFDGVHLGHRAVLQATIDAALELGAPAYAMTFEPHPYQVFRKDVEPFLIMQPQHKRYLLRELGIDGVITFPFTPEAAQMSARDFVEQVLIKACRVRQVVVGFDFVFGQGRRADAQQLAQLLEPHGVNVTIVEPQRDEGGEIISSSRIRDYLRNGQIEKANALLGRFFTIYGSIESGDQRGRELSFPTANISLGNTIRPAYGVYTVLTKPAGEEIIFPGIANIGVRPTFEGKTEMLEVHFFDFSGTVYAKDWVVSLLSYLRAEKKFDNVEDLKRQIEKDIQVARQLLQTKVDAALSKIVLSGEEYG